MAVRLTKKTKVLLVASFVLFWGMIAGGAVLWTLYASDTQVTGTDSEAGTLCSESDWGCPCGCNASDTACIPADQCGGDDPPPPDNSCSGNPDWNCPCGCNASDTACIPADQCGGGGDDPPPGTSYCAVCAPADSCECVYDAATNTNVPTGSKCKFAPAECSDLGYTWQPDSSCSNHVCPPVQQGCGAWCELHLCDEDTNNDGQCTNADAGHWASGPKTDCSQGVIDGWINQLNGCGQIDLYDGAVGDYGSYCSSPGGGIDMGGCSEPQDDSCTVTATATCVPDGTDDVKVTVDWNVTQSNFPIGPDFPANEGIVIVRINDLRDGWFTDSTDTWWSTKYSAFIASGGDPKNSSWTFDDRIEPNVNYDVRVAVNAPDSDDGHAVCSTTPIVVNCSPDDPDPLACNASGCSNNSDCTTGYCHNGICRNSLCPNSTDCECPIVVDNPYCNDNECNQSSESCENGLSCLDGSAVSCRQNCTYCGDGIENGGEACDDGNSNNDDDCRNDCTLPRCGDGTVDTGEVCDDGNLINGDGCSDQCEEELEGDLSVEKIASAVCLEGKDASARVTYKITLTNSGEGDSIIDNVVDTLDSKVQDSWVDSASISPTGTLSGGKITWDISSITNMSDSLSPGETMDFNYSITVPYTAFGNYDNTVVVTDSEGGTVTDSNTVNVTCTIPTEPLPETGLLDNTIFRTGLGIGLIVSTIWFMMSDRGENLVLFTMYADRRRDARRKEFEDRVVSD